MNDEYTPSSSDDTVHNDAELDSQSPLTTEAEPSTLEEEKSQPIAGQPSLGEQVFNGLSYIGLPVLILLATLLSIQLFFGGGIGVPGESLDAYLYGRVREGGILHILLGGAPFVAEPTLYYGFLALLEMIPGISGELLIPLGSAIAGILFISAAWILARATGHNRQVALAAGFLCLGALPVADAFLRSGQDLLGGAILALAFAAVYRAWRKQSAPLWLFLGFVLVALAFFVQGPFSLCLLLGSSVLFLLVRGTPGRLNGKDGLLGFFFMLLLLGAWFGLFLYAGEGDYLKDLVARTRQEFGGRGSWNVPHWYYAAVLALVWLPWTLSLLFINWWQAAKELPQAWKGRKEEGGRLWLWITFLVGLGLLSAGAFVLFGSWLLLVPFLAVVSARAILRLSPGRSRSYFGLLGLVFCISGLGLDLYHFSREVASILPDPWLSGLPEQLQTILFLGIPTLPMGLTLFIGGCLLFFMVKRQFPGGSLVAAALILMVTFQGYVWTTVPALTSIDTSLVPDSVFHPQPEPGLDILLEEEPLLVDPLPPLLPDAPILDGSPLSEEEFSGPDMVQDEPVEEENQEQGSAPMVPEQLFPQEPGFMIPLPDQTEPEAPENLPEDFYLLPPALDEFGVEPPEHIAGHDGPEEPVSI